jgi:hypothetical protein
MELWTTADGEIIDVSDRIPRFLNLGRRALIGRSIENFFNGNRARVFLALDLAARGHAETFQAEVRPRECRPVKVAVRLHPDTSSSVHWRFEVTQSSP